MSLAAKVTQQIFGTAYDSSAATVGILGVGPSLDGWTSPYPFFIDSLFAQGITHSRAFSLELGGLDSSSGSVVFGGIDTKKYAGDLVKLPIINPAQSPDGYTRFWISLDGISVNQPNGAVISVYAKPDGGNGQAVLLDSGSTLSALPTAIFNKLVAAFPSAQYIASSGLVRSSRDIRMEGASG